jgi:hypothetical protein
MRFNILLSFFLFYAVNIQAQKVCRQNYKNEASLSYSNLMNFVFGAVGLSYERTIHHKKKSDKFISLQFEYASKLDLYNVATFSRVPRATLTPTLKYNFGDKHIYSIGVGASLSLLNTTPTASFS